MQDEVKLESIIEGQKRMENVRGIEGHVIRIGQHGLAQENKGIPEGELTAGIRIDQHLAKRVVETENIAKVKVLGGEEKI
jgi:hypothetical protein